MKFFKVFTPLVVTFLAYSASAGISLAPKAFSYKSNKVAFIDITNAKYHVYFDAKTKSATSLSILTFTQETDGFPLFDLVPNILSATLDDKNVAISEVASPDKTTKFRVIESLTQPGTHTLTIKAEYKLHVAFESGAKPTVKHAFFFSDLGSDRTYLEQYLPTNLEYDQYPSEISLQYLNFSTTASEQEVFSNGTELSRTADTITISFPEYFNAASFFLQSAPKGRFKSQTTMYQGIKAIIPITVFSKDYDLNRFDNAARKILKDLESRFGPWPHASLVIYASNGGEVPGAGGMEYAGATITAEYALSHEMFHSYNARSTMPSAGHAGWMDEALASWRDDGYRIRERFPMRQATLSNPLSYIRYINDLPYSYGKAFIEAIAGIFDSKKRSFFDSVVEFYHQYTHQTVDTEILKTFLEGKLGASLSSEFDKYVYNKTKSSGPVPLVREENSKYHHRWTEKELVNLL